MSVKYHAREFRPGLWHVVDETGHPLFDGERDGEDKPVVFLDGDKADECAARMNNEDGE